MFSGTTNQNPIFVDVARQTAEPRHVLLPPELSIIIPVLNEVENLKNLNEKVTNALNRLNSSWEIIYIDDGSSDGSYQLLCEMAKLDSRIKVIRFVRNFGQTAALSCGIDHAEGQIIVPMDADLQNDPDDIGKLLGKIAEGYDVVSGWRKNRQDELLSRLIPSWCANKIISVISGVRLHDYGCSLKAYRREVIKDIRLYGEMHRFVPIYASWMGAKVTEIPVNHNARQFGQSKYGIERTFKVILDLMTVKFLSTYITKPIYVFGSAGLWSFVAATLGFAWMLILKYGYNCTFIQTPLPVLVAMFFMLGIQFILMGLMAEILMRTYHESQDKRIYIIKSRVNTSIQGND